MKIENKVETLVKWADFDGEEVVIKTAYIEGKTEEQIKANAIDYFGGKKNIPTNMKICFEEQYNVHYEAPYTEWLKIAKVTRTKIEKANTETE